MRTTIDMPDGLMEQIRPLLARHNLSFRDLVILSIERALSGKDDSFRLRDASAGKKGRLSPDAINRAIDEIRSPTAR